MTRPRLEISAVLLTGVVNFFLADRLGLRLAFVVGACLFWLGFVAIRASADASVLERWGFTTRDLGRSLTLLAPLAVLAVSCFTAYGIFTGRLYMHWHVALILTLYSVCGLVQQFLIVALLAGNLRTHSRIPQRWIVLLTALVSAIAHAVSVPLTVAAFFLAAVTTTIHFRTRNMWALGLFHGVFATEPCHLALGQDLLTEVVSARQWP